jgi:LacI family transcriptional regulator
VPFFSDENIGLFMTTLENVLSEAGYSILIQGVTPEYESSGKAVRILRNNTADGLLIWDAFQDPDTINALNEEHRPAICVAFPYESAESFIVPDNEGGAFQMARHLLDLGHRKIAYFSGGMGELVDRHREDGCRKALAEAGVEPVVLTGYYTHSGGRECMEAILRDHPDITAIFAANDLMALGAMDVAMDAGKRVPEDLSIAGFDGSSHAMISRPRLTTGKLPMAEIGRLAGEHILRMAEEDRPEPLSLTLPIEIIPGGSTAKLRRG